MNSMHATATKRFAIQCKRSMAIRTLATEVSNQTAPIIRAMPLPARTPEILKQSFLTSEPVDLLELSPSIFDPSRSIRRDILHRCVVFEMNAQRAGTASTKTRSEIRGSKRKLRPQKGSGMARIGSISSPMLRGGATTFGPRPKDWTSDLPLKVWQMGIRHALLSKYVQGQLTVVDSLGLPTHKTRYLEKTLSSHHWSGKPALLLRWSTEEAEAQAMMIAAADAKTEITALKQLSKALRRWNNLELAARNMSYAVQVAEWDEIGVWDLLKWENLVIETPALASLQESVMED